jgi:hypothetical protein
LRGGLSNPFAGVFAGVCIRAKCRYPKNAGLDAANLAAKIRTTVAQNPNDTAIAGAAMLQLATDIETAVSTFVNSTGYKAAVT